MNSFSPLLVLLLAQLPPPAGSGHAWTLPEVLKLASVAHPDVVEAEIRAEQAHADVVTAGLLPNPQAQLGVSNVPTYRPHSSPWGGLLVYGVGLSEDFELGGKRAKRMASAETAVEGQEATVKDVRRTTRSDVEGAFYKALAAQEHLRTAEEMLARYLDTVRLTQARVSAGDLAGADLNKIELETFRYEAEVHAQTQAAAAARGELFRLLGLRGSTDGDRVEGKFPAPVVSTPDAAEIDRAMAQRPDLLALRAQHKKAEADLALARAQVIPNVNLSLGYSFSGTEVPSGADSLLALGASIPLPIFDRNQGEVQKAELEVERTEHALSRARLDAEREVALAQNHLLQSDAVVRKLEGAYLQKAERARVVAEKTYLEGHTSLLEALEAERTLLETHYTYLDAQLERSLGAIEMARALGKQETQP